MRSSSVSLGLVFIVIAALAVFGIPGIGVPGARVGPLGYALAGVLGVTGVLVMLSLRVAFPAGLFAGAATLIIAVLDWKRVGGGHLGLPFPPALSAVMGAYIIFRISIGKRTFGPRKQITRVPDPLP